MAHGKLWHREKQQQKKVDYFIYFTSKYLLQSNITFALDLRELNIGLFEKMKVAQQIISQYYKVPVHGL